MRIRNLIILALSPLSITYGISTDQNEKDPLIHEHTLPKPFEIFPNDKEVLFVSLGSSCSSASMIRDSGCRVGGYMPFDWICSKNSDKLIEILHDDFLHFFNDDYIFICDKYSPHIVNSYYYFDFPNSFEDSEEKFRSKYRRRIERFRKLKDYQGQVIFVRCASGYEGSLYYEFEEAHEITDTAAFKLYDTLKTRFPKLDFLLVILNEGFGEGLLEERKVADNIWMIRSNYHQDQYIKLKSFRDFFIKLLSLNQIMELECPTRGCMIAKSPLLPIVCNSFSS